MDRQDLIQALSKMEQNGWWDEEAIYESDEAFLSSPFVSFIKVFHDFNQESLSWLTYFAMKKVFSGRSAQVEILQQLIDYLEGGQDVDWEGLSSIVSGHIQAAAVTQDEWVEAAAASLESGVRYIATGDYQAAVDCIFNADHALELVNGTDFKKWLIETALPSALKKESMVEEAFKQDGKSPAGNTWKVVYFPDDS